MSATSSSTRPHRRITHERARELLRLGATVDLPRRATRIPCRFGRHRNWWDVEDADRLLTLGSELWEVTSPETLELVVVDGIDLYRFEVGTAADATSTDG